MITREQAIEIARRNGALQAVADWLMQASARAGELISEELARTWAEVVIADYGDTTGRTANEIMAPFWPSPGTMPDGPRTRGWRVTGQAQRLRTAQLIIGPRRRAADERAKVEVAIRARARTLARRAQAFIEDAGPDRQRQAHALVRIELLSLAEAGRRMGVTKQAVAKLLKKYDRTRGLTIPAEVPPKGVGDRERGDAQVAETTTVSSRRQYLNEVTLDLDDVAEAAGLDIEYVLALWDKHDLLDDAAVGEPARLRPYSIAVLLMVTELADLVTDGALSAEEAGSVFRELMPRLRDAFDGLVAREYDHKQLDITVTRADGEQIKLQFLALAWAKFIIWLSQRTPKT